MAQHPLDILHRASNDSEELANFVGLCSIGIINTQAAPRLVEQVKRVSLRLDPKSKYRDPEYAKSRMQSAEEIAKSAEAQIKEGIPHLYRYATVWLWPSHWKAQSNEGSRDQMNDRTETQVTFRHRGDIPARLPSVGMPQTAQHRQREETMSNRRGRVDRRRQVSFSLMTAFIVRSGNAEKASTTFYSRTSPAMRLTSQG